MRARPLPKPRRLQPGGAGAAALTLLPGVRGRRPGCLSCSPALALRALAAAVPVELCRPLRALSTPSIRHRSSSSSGGDEPLHCSGCLLQRQARRSDLASMEAQAGEYRSSMGGLPARTRIAGRLLSFRESLLAVLVPVEETAFAVDAVGTTCWQCLLFKFMYPVFESSARPARGCTAIQVVLQTHTSPPASTTVPPGRDRNSDRHSHGPSASVSDCFY